MTSSARVRSPPGVRSKPVAFYAPQAVKRRASEEIAGPPRYLRYVARPLRIQFPNALYHVTSRGVDRGPIFRDDEDPRTFVTLLARELERSRWLCHAYCLMPNHFHLVVETLEATLSKGMHRLNSRYAQAYNRRHGRTGHLLQGRFHAVLIEKERHLLEVARYVVLNPCRAGLCGHPDDWDWSSYRATAGLDASQKPVSPEFLLAQFGTSPERAKSRYREFVAEGSGADPWRGRFASSFPPLSTT